MTTGGFDLSGIDMGALLAQAQSVQGQLEAAQTQLAESSFEGTAGGGLVRATVTGT
ncbi:MAG: YbaB/EbfC family nucleoid-associated protein, partial [Cutibacterium avidum]|nr:YbaB/EbfC family nucleoid-associated protein [Cutibacterium avidum]